MLQSAKSTKHACVVGCGKGYAKASALALHQQTCVHLQYAHKQSQEIQLRQALQDITHAKLPSTTVLEPEPSLQADSPVVDAAPTPRPYDHLLISPAMDVDETDGQLPGHVPPAPPMTASR
ncbi:hypothetical protein D9756_007252 [Leucocoprinus leucothites]|uniref:C2H2-type domain-containing protein n=1 Tax=Leucocoprinus leucothites TaxID=201217 RepID=A0A8H5FYP4_9AGAR|nr:hypothetical protein D9756_007252 [Leucoagaricus leucothites]